MLTASNCAKWRTNDGINISVDPDNFHKVMAKCAKESKHPLTCLKDIIGAVYDVDSPWTWYIGKVLTNNYAIDSFYDEAFCKQFAEWIIAVINECEKQLFDSTGHYLNLGGN